MANEINKMTKAEATINGHLTHIRKHASSKTNNKKIGDKHKNAYPIQ